MFSHFTGFDSYAGFMDMLKFILPNLDRKLLIYWDNTAGKSSVIDTEKNFSKKMKVIWRRTGMKMNLKSGKPKQDVQHTSFRLRMNF